MDEIRLAVKKIAEGKTKVILQSEYNPELVYIESNDYITAGDGERRHFIKGKGILANKTTCNCFKIVSQIAKTHFISEIDDRTFLAQKVKMIPIEIVIRALAYGSYLKRNPNANKGKQFGEWYKEFVVELFFKDDYQHDPLMIWSQEKECFELYDAKKPLSEGYLQDFPKDVKLFPKSLAEINSLEQMGKHIFGKLEACWYRQNVVLVDLKIECGYTSDGELVVADVIDNDSWRIWPGGDEEQMKDKQIYRNLSKVDRAAIQKIKENYTWVAEETKKFLYN